MKTLLLICGPPGSGKSTLAMDIVTCARPTALEVCADDYLADPITGEYKFDVSKLQAAHKNCFICVRHAVLEGTDLVIVHNTFVRREHRAPYQALAEKYGYFYQEIHIAFPRPEGNVHNVPPQTVARMMQQKEWPTP